MDIKLRVPEGRSGDWAVEYFTVTQKDILWAMFHYKDRAPSIGNYVRLRYQNSVVMSNTRAEIHDHREFIRNATGVVLINGLGLGLCIEAILANKGLEKVYVVEASADVIKLVAPTYTDPRVEIIHADALSYTPPKGIKYDYVWHDIWTNISADNLEEMKRLHRKYGRIAGWQGSWARKQCEKLNREDTRYYRASRFR